MNVKQEQTKSSESKNESVHYSNISQLLELRLKMLGIPEKERINFLNLYHEEEDEKIQENQNKYDINIQKLKDIQKLKIQKLQ